MSSLVNTGSVETWVNAQTVGRALEQTIALNSSYHYVRVGTKGRRWA